MIKISYIITRLTLGGAQETVFPYLSGLAKEQFEVKLLSGPDNDFVDQEVLNRLPVHYIPSLSNSINIIKDLKAILEIYKYLKREKPDIVHTHSSKAGILGRIAARLAGVSTIFHTVHGWSFNNQMSRFKRALYILLERFAARFTTKLIVVTKTDIEKGIKNKIGTPDLYTVIRSGIDFEKFSNPNWQEVQKIRLQYGEKKIIGTVARLSEQKNVVDFLKTAKLLLAKRQDVHFLIVGDGPLREQLEQFIAENALSAHITLLGLRNDVPTLIYCFDVFLLTSLWEGLPRVVLEAMYCGVPVVANNVDGISEIIKDGINGFTTHPFDVQKSALYVQTLLDNSSIRVSVISNAKSSANKDFGINSMIQKTAALYLDATS